MTRTALITGASRGLGLALARTLAADGWQLIITARGAEPLEAAHQELSTQTRVIALAGDITDPVHRNAIKDATEELKNLDAIFNNASTLGMSPQPALLDYPIERLEQVYRVNVFAPLALLQTLRASICEETRIFNISSDAAVEAYAGWGGYGSSKAAFEHLSAILAQENPQWRIYWIDPGDMQTQMHQEAFPGEDITDRPLPETVIPAFMQLLTDENFASGRYQAQALLKPTT